MIVIDIRNPFNSPVYHEETVSSTMEISRKLAVNGAPHGTVITCDFQQNGRGRKAGRSWDMERAVNLPFTILLRYPRLENIPAVITLRAGLAVLFAIEDFAPSLNNQVKIKWPNDILINSKKVAGILCEADSGTVHLGIGVNVAQREFPVDLRGKATSIELAMNNEQRAMNNEQLTFNIEQAKFDLRYVLLEKILIKLHDMLDSEVNKDWRLQLEKRLYKKGEQVVFIEGEADSGKEVKGCLMGIGEHGELVIFPDGEREPRSFFSGELKK